MTFALNISYSDLPLLLIISVDLNVRFSSLANKIYFEFVTNIFLLKKEGAYNKSSALFFFFQHISKVSI